MTHVRVVLLLALVGLGGCGDHSASSTSLPLGRSLGAEPAPVRQAPTPAGDPPEERNGTVLQGQVGEPSPSSNASSPRAALRRYALAYTNWQAISLPAHERELALLAVGAARLAAEQIATSESGAASLAANHVQNKGVVLAITASQGSARGQWVVVTEEWTTGAGPYAGLPPSAHVTVARLIRLRHGWAVDEWRPES